MVTLKLTRTEFQTMVVFLRNHTQWNHQLPLINRIPSLMLLEDYLVTWKTVRLVSWIQRRPDKTYGLSLKPAEALPLH